MKKIGYKNNFGCLEKSVLGYISLKIFFSFLCILAILNENRIYPALIMQPKNGISN